jgi:hypothetical protein
MQLIDTHVHINFDTFQADLDEVASRWRKAGVVHLVHSCVEPAEFSGIQAIADRYPELSFAVGLHPLDVEERWTVESPQEILRLAQSDQRVVAIGETGLATRDHSLPRRGGSNGGMVTPYLAATGTCCWCHALLEWHPRRNQVVSGTGILHQFQRHRDV